MSGWNGWQYGKAPQETPSNDGSGVNYVQLNWADLLGGQGTQQTVTTTGTSAFQMPQQESNYQGIGYHQNGQEQPAANFRVSVGNQGDQNAYQLVNPAQQQEMSPAPQFPGWSGDQNVSQRKTTARMETPRKVVPCCGSCTACKYQKARAATKPFLVRNEGDFPK